MRATASLRRRTSPRAAFAAWWALAAAFCFALLPALHAPAMVAAVPAGFAIVCTGDGVALIPADPSLPPLDNPPAAHAQVCLDCCPAQTAALPPPAISAALAPKPGPVADDAAPHAPSSVPPPGPFPRGPPRA